MSDDRLDIEQIVNNYSAMIYRFIFRLVTEEAVAVDLTQDTFIKVWRSLDVYDGRHDIKNWIFLIARRTTIDWLRKKRPISFSKLYVEEENEFAGHDFEGNLQDEGELPDELFAQKEIRRKLELAISNLPLVYREVFYLKLDNDLSFPAISETLGKPLNTIKSLYRRGLVMLRSLLKEQPIS